MVFDFVNPNQNHACHLCSLSGMITLMDEKDLIMNEFLVLNTVVHMHILYVVVLLIQQHACLFLHLAPSSPFWSVFQVRALEFSPCSPTLLASGSEDGLILVWDIANIVRQHVCSISPHISGSYACVFAYNDGSEMFNVH